MRSENMLLLIVATFCLLSFSLKTGEEDDPYRLYEEYQKLLSREKEISKEIDQTIAKQKEVSKEIENLKFIKEVEEKILRGYTK